MKNKSIFSVMFLFFLFCLTSCNIWYYDADGDGYGDASNSITLSDQQSPPSGYVDNGDDCNDGDDTVYPGAAELCDSIDNQCPGDVGYGETDEGCKVHKPVCLFQGTKSEGWYWADLQGAEAFIMYSMCSDSAEPQCLAIGSKSEGWYTNAKEVKLIVWDICHRVVDYALEGETCGPDIAECYGEDLSCKEGICVRE